MGIFPVVLCVACAAAFFNGSTAGSLQPAGSAYRNLVAGYRTGDVGAVERLIRMPEDAVTDGVDRALQTGDTSLAWHWRELRAAALLHTVAWYRGLVDKRTSRTSLDLGLAERLLWGSPETHLLNPISRSAGTTSWRGCSSMRG